MKIVSKGYVLVILGITTQIVAVEKSTIETHIGRTFVIALPENPTTGYTWYWQVSDDAQHRAIELTKKEFVAKEPSMIGSGGTARFTFKAMHAGKVPVVLTLKRIWEKNSDVDQKRVEVNILPKKHKKGHKIIA